MPNRLIYEASPYLQQHAHNPVDWYPWSDEAFAKAKAEAKPVLLSVGYSSCHWCHVMERESFDDPDIARLMNDLFVSIKVDREERPDLDDLYMKAVQLLTGRGGWPMTVFLTPDREPFHAGTYFPPADRHGMPGFPRVLAAVARAYQERPDEVASAAAQLRDGIGRVDAVVPSGAALDASLPARAAAALLRHVDETFGGLGHAPKFPNTQAFQLLLREGVRSGNPAMTQAVELTCRRMAEGGIYDHIGGGFHRYSVDQRWLVPHFEKMLYDNAQIPRLYLESYQATGDPHHRRVVEETLDYLLRDMRDPAGGFYSATDADSEGEEGRYFVWTPQEVAAVVPQDDVDLVCRYWDITGDGNFEGKSIAHVTTTQEDLARSLGRSPAAVEQSIAAARELLREARSRRVPPLRDEKVLTSWNALAIGTLAEAGRVLDVERYVRAAEQAAAFVWSAMRREGRLLHVWFRGTGKQEAFLDDHAFLISAFLDLEQATGKDHYRRWAAELLQALEEQFYDPEHGGYFFTPAEGETLIARSKPGTDGSIPSGNGAAALALLRLYELTGTERYRQRAEEILRLFYDSAVRNAFGYMTILEALARYTGAGTEVVLVGPDGPEMVRLERALAETFVPLLTVVRARPGSPPPPLAEGRPAVDGKPTAYVCRSFTCSAPVTDADALRSLLAGQRP